MSRDSNLPTEYTVKVHYYGTGNNGSVTGHVNVSLTAGRTVYTIGNTAEIERGNLQGGPTTSDPGPYGKGEFYREPESTTTFKISREGYEKATKYAQYADRETELGRDGYSLKGENCVDFADTVLDKAGVKQNVSDVLKNENASLSATKIYASQKDKNQAPQNVEAKKKAAANQEAVEEGAEEIENTRRAAA